MSKQNDGGAAFRKSFELEWERQIPTGENDQPDSAKESIFCWAKWGHELAERERSNGQEAR